MKTSENRIYAAIDLKSFYASVECIERGLDPLATNLVVADASRTSKTICLAVSPALKSYGIPGRARLFEVIQKVKEANTGRRQGAPGFRFSGSSVNDRDLKADPALSIDYIAAPPRMALYMEYSTRIYNRNLLGGLYRENPVKSRNYEAVKSSKKWENVGNSYIIPALLLYRYSYI